MSLIIESLSAAAAVVPALIPDPSPVQPPGTGGFVTVLAWAKWIGFGLAALAFIIAGIRLMFGGRRGEGEEHVGALGKVLAGVIIVGSAVGVISAFMGG